MELAALADALLAIDLTYDVESDPIAAVRLRSCSNSVADADSCSPWVVSQVGDAEWKDLISAAFSPAAAAAAEVEDVFRIADAGSVLVGTLVRPSLPLAGSVAIESCLHADCRVFRRVWPPSLASSELHLLLGRGNGSELGVGNSGPRKQASRLALEGGFLRGASRLRSHVAAPGGTLFVPARAVAVPTSSWRMSQAILSDSGRDLYLVGRGSFAPGFRVPSPEAVPCDLLLDLQFLHEEVAAAGVGGLRPGAVRTRNPLLGVQGAVECRILNATTVRVVVGPGAEFDASSLIRANPTLHWHGEGAPLDVSRTKVPTCALSSTFRVGLCDSVELDATLSGGGGGGRPLAFNWTLQWSPALETLTATEAGLAVADADRVNAELAAFSDASTSAALLRVRAAALGPYPGQLFARVSVRSFLDLASGDCEVAITRVGAPLPSLSFHGPSVVRTRADRSLRLTAEASLPEASGCPPGVSDSLSLPSRDGGVAYNWSISDDRIPLRRTRDVRSRIIPGGSLVPGRSVTVAVGVVAAASGPDSESSSKRATVTVVPEYGRVVAIVRGGNRAVGSNASFELDATASFAEEAGRDSWQVLEYSWKCRMAPAQQTDTGAVRVGARVMCQDGRGEVFGVDYASRWAVRNGTLALLRVPPGTLVPGYTYEFTVAAHRPRALVEEVRAATAVGPAALRQEGTVGVFVSQRAPPPVSLRPAQQRLNPGDEVAFRGTAPGAANTRLRWAVTDAASGEEVTFQPPLVPSATLVVPAGTLQAGRSYAFSLAVTEGTVTGMASATVVVNAPPRGGTVAVSPLRGVALSTEFTLVAAAWTDDAADLPLAYNFGVLDGRAEAGAILSGEAVPSWRGIEATLLLDQPQAASYYVSPLPAGPEAANETVTVVCIVEDALGAAASTAHTASGATARVTVARPLLSASALDSRLRAAGDSLLQSAGAAGAAGADTAMGASPARALAELSASVTTFADDPCGDVDCGEFGNCRGGVCECDPGYRGDRCREQVGIDGGYAPWSAWSGCTRACGGGRQLRFRSCTAPAPARGGRDCAGLGPSQEGRACNTEPCTEAQLAQRGGPSAWSPWEPCDAACSPEQWGEARGKQRRWRTCSEPAPGASDGACAFGGVDVQTRVCAVSCPGVAMRCPGSQRDPRTLTLTDTCSGHGACTYVSAGAQPPSGCRAGSVGCTPVCVCEEGWMGEACAQVLSTEAARRMFKSKALAAFSATSPRTDATPSALRQQSIALARVGRTAADLDDAGRASVHESARAVAARAWNATRSGGVDASAARDTGRSVLTALGGALRASLTESVAAGNRARRRLAAGSGGSSGPDHDVAGALEAAFDVGRLLVGPASWGEPQGQQVEVRGMALSVAASAGGGVTLALPGGGGDSWVHVPSSALTSASLGGGRGVAMAVVLYSNPFAAEERPSSTPKRLGAATPVVALHLGSDAAPSQAANVTSLSDPVFFDVELNTANEVPPGARCAYWDHAEGRWSDRGVFAAGALRTDATGRRWLRCATTHLSEFALAAPASAGPEPERQPVVHAPAAPTSAPLLATWSERAPRPSLVVGGAYAVLAFVAVLAWLRDRLDADNLRADMRFHFLRSGKSQPDSQDPEVLLSDSAPESSDEGGEDEGEMAAVAWEDGASEQHLPGGRGGGKEDVAYLAQQQRLAMRQGRVAEARALARRLDVLRSRGACFRLRKRANRLCRRPKRGARLCRRVTRVGLARYAAALRGRHPLLGLLFAGPDDRVVTTRRQHAMVLWGQVATACAACAAALAADPNRAGSVALLSVAVAVLVVVPTPALARLYRYGNLVTEGRRAERRRRKMLRVRVAELATAASSDVGRAGRALAPSPVSAAKVSPASLHTGAGAQHGVAGPQRALPDGSKSRRRAKAGVYERKLRDRRRRLLRELGKQGRPAWPTAAAEVGTRAWARRGVSARVAPELEVVWPGVDEEGAEGVEGATPYPPSRAQAWASDASDSDDLAYGSDEGSASGGDAAGRDTRGGIVLETLFPGSEAQEDVAPTMRPQSHRRGGGQHLWGATELRQAELEATESALRALSRRRSTGRALLLVGGVVATLGTSLASSGAWLTVMDTWANAQSIGVTASGALLLMGAFQALRAAVAPRLRTMAATVATVIVVAAAVGVCCALALAGPQVPAVARWERGTVRAAWLAHASAAEGGDADAATTLAAVQVAGRCCGFDRGDGLAVGGMCNSTRAASVLAQDSPRYAEPLQGPVPGCGSHLQAAAAARMLPWWIACAAAAAVLLPAAVVGRRRQRDLSRLVAVQRRLLQHEYAVGGAETEAAARRIQKAWRAARMGIRAWRTAQFNAWEKRAEGHATALLALDAAVLVYIAFAAYLCVVLTAYFDATSSRAWLITTVSALLANHVVLYPAAIMAASVARAVHMPVLCADAGDYVPGG